MTYYIEQNFPIEKLNPLARREANAKRPIAMLHKWWARRLGCVFRTIILSSLIPAEEWKRLDEEVRRAGLDAWTALYYREHPKAKALIERYLKDKIVLDPFMGGGTTIVEALRLGCKVIGVDVNPVAWFITKKSIEPVDLTKLDAAFERLKEEVAPEILYFYRTRCPLFEQGRGGAWEQGSRGAEELGSGGASTSTPLHLGTSAHLADVMYVFWVKRVRCASCGRKTKLFNSFRLATKKGKDVVFCPRCYWVGDVEEGTPYVVCPDCGHEFAPREGYSKGGRFRCEHCGHVDKLVDWVRRTGQAPEYEMFAVEYWCPTCKVRGYKGADEFDRELYRQACLEFEREKAKLPLPEGEIPAEGRSDPRPISFGLRHWTDLFNPRQLLCLGTLLKAILEIEDKAVRELMVVTLSDAVNASNMLCKYNAHRFELEPLFGHHAYWPPDQPVENNVWGTKFGRGTFRSYYGKTRRAVEWLLTPKEVTSDGKVPMSDSPMTPVAKTSEVFKTSEVSRAWLAARSAEDLAFIPSKSVDAVITDPPYYSNVQYAELSDFFYVWLRASLAGEYPEFNSPIVPKETEIVVNTKAGKTDEHFREGLLRCFEECHRVLKDDGLMAFTFHHEEPKAWGAVLEAVLEAGFDVRAVWTYHSEARTGFHAEGIRFDTIIVCRKRLEEAEPAAWGELRDKIVLAVREELRRLLENGAALSTEDVFVITMGKALPIYSRHWPKVLHNGQEVRLTQAIEDIEALVDEQIDAYFGMVTPPWLDVLPRVYLQHLARRAAVTKDALVKACRTRGLDFAELERAGLIKRAKKAGLYEVLSPQKRLRWLEDRLEEGEDLSPIDRAHYLYALYKAGRPLRGEIPRVYTKGLEEVCEALYRITRDRAYEVIGKEIGRVKEQRMLM
jgi:adenine-specific DNA methylase